LAIALLVISGCAGTRSTWQCTGASCVTLETALTKCRAKANAYFVAQNDEGFIAQCMVAEGFKQVPCDASNQQSSECR
jgi:hypothetical protein